MSWAAVVVDWMVKFRPTGWSFKAITMGIWLGLGKGEGEGRKRGGGGKRVMG
jgi:hypothetical protein